MRVTVASAPLARASPALGAPPDSPPAGSGAGENFGEIVAEGVGARMYAQTPLLHAHRGEGLEPFRPRRVDGVLTPEHHLRYYMPLGVDMAGTNSADIVFVIDTSRSMAPCIEGVKRHISTFVDVFKSDPSNTWDLRLDFVAHNDTLQEARAAGADKDFRERVVAAGGAYDNVDVRATLIWSDITDLDLHVWTPAGERIYFGEKRSSCGGELDIDRNVGESSATRQPVENIRWLKDTAKPGEYVVSVMNFSNRTSGSVVRARLEVVVAGQVRHIDVEVPARHRAEVEVTRFTFDPRVCAASAGPASGGPGAFRARSCFEDPLLRALYGAGQGRFFTTDLAAFQRGVGTLPTGGNESPLVALDCALDMPWRARRQTHRIVVFLTDEPVEGGNRQEESLRKISDIISKMHTLKVMLFLVSPDSAGFESLAAADKCEWEVVDGGDGLASVDFAKLLTAIAKSISRSQTPLGAPPPEARRALFGQDRW